MVHNETANIWTHFIAAIMFIILIFVLTIPHEIIIEEAMAQSVRIKFDNFIVSLTQKLL